MAGKKLLVADDSLTIQKIIRLALANEGYEIQTVSDGDEAIKQIALFHPDVVLVDVSLPKKSAADIKEEFDQDPAHEDVRFVLMLNAFEQINDEKIDSLGFHGRLVKPFDPGHLRDILLEVLQGQKSSLTPPAPPYQSDEALSDDLWDESSQETEPEFTPPPPPPFLKEKQTSSNDSGFETDIRELTESTIRMSGLDEFQWSVNEPAKLNDLETDKSASSLIQNDVHEEIGENTFVNLSKSEPSIEPPQNLYDIGDSSFDLSQLDKLDDALAKMNKPTPPSFPNEINFSSIGEHSLPSFEGDEIQKIVQQELKDSIEKIVREVLPQVAEKIIKDEIQKILSNPPQD